MNPGVGSWVRRERLRFWTPIVLVGAYAAAVAGLFVVGIGAIS